MAALPKKKSSKSRTGKRHSARHITLPNLAPCPSCGKLKLSHTVCPSCGAYGSTKLTTGGSTRSASSELTTSSSK